MRKKIESRRIVSLSVAALISLNTFGAVFAGNVIKEDISEPVSIEAEENITKESEVKDVQVKDSQVNENAEKPAKEAKKEVKEVKEVEETEETEETENIKNDEIKIDSQEIKKDNPVSEESLNENKTDKKLNQEVKEEVQENSKEETPATLEELIDETILEEFTIEGNGVVKTKHTLKAQARSKNEVLYKFFIKDLKTNKWSVIQDYSKKSSADWTPAANGKYQYGVHIKDSESIYDKEAHRYVNFEIADLKPAVLNRFAIEGNSKINTPHTLKAYAKSTNEVLYKFFIKDLKTNKWTVIQDYSEKDSATWVPEKDGSYWYGVHIKDSMSKLDKDSHKYAPIKIEQIDPAVLESVNIEGVLEAKTPQTITAKASAENGVLYKFFIKDLKTNKWEMIQDYSDKNTVTWIPSAAGNYQYGVHVKDRLSTRDKDSHKYTPMTIDNLKPAEILDFTIEGSAYEKTNHTLVANAAGRNEVLYKFFIKDLKTNKWTMIQDYSTKNSVNWKPDEIGKYEYGVHVKDKLSDRDVDNHLYKLFTVNPPVYYTTSNYGDTLEQALAKQVGQNTISKGGKWVKASSDEIKQYLDPNRFLQFAPKASEVRFTEGTVTASSLNLRSGPSASYDKIGETTKGTVHKVFDQSGGWYLIEHSGVRGWVSGSYLSFKEAERGEPNHLISLEILASGLNVRQAPNTTSDILTTVNSGNVYVVLETRGDWYQINAGGKVGWVSGEFTKLINDVPREMYQFMVLSGQSGVSTAVMNKELQSMGILEGRGAAFIEGSRKYNVNELYLMAHAFLETGKGTSSLAKGILVSQVDGKPVEPRVVYNMYGIGAIDSNPIQGGTERAYKEGWFTPELAITEGAHWISKNYINNQTYKQDTLYKMKYNPVKPGTHQYATDIAWPIKQTRQIDLMMEVARNTEGVILRFDIPKYR